MEVYLEIEDDKYARKIAELFENLTEGCLYELLNFKRESDEMARIIGRYTSPGYLLSDEDISLLNKHGYCLREEDEK